MAAFDTSRRAISIISTACRVSKTYTVLLLKTVPLVETVFNAFINYFRLISY